MNSIEEVMVCNSMISIHNVALLNCPEITRHILAFSNGSLDGQCDRKLPFSNESTGTKKRLSTLRY